MTQGFFADCQFNGTTRQCQYAFAAVEFNSAEGERYNLSIALSGLNNLWLMPERQAGLTNPIFFWNSADGRIEEDYPSAFNTFKDDTYLYKGNIVEAVIISQNERNFIFDQVLVVCQH